MKTLPEDLAQSRLWLASNLTRPEDLPISFMYGDQMISGIPREWQAGTTRRQIDSRLMETIMLGKDPITGLSIRVECLKYRDYPVVDWVVWLENNGNQPSPIIQDFQALNASFAGDAPLLHHCNGDFYSVNGYTPQITSLQPDDLHAFAPTGGRPCDGAFPYFRIQFADRGLTIAVGWPAQWSASFHSRDDGVHVSAGQQTVHLRLQPGEKIRSPRMTILFWTGDTPRAINLWRSWYLDHILPRPAGQPLQPLLACAATDTGEEFTNANEENQLQYMQKMKNVGLDYDVWWIDAGWYPCRDEQHDLRWWRTGTWMPDPERFPNGLTPIAANARENNARLLVWFEPERVTIGSQLEKDHPEWLLEKRPAPGEAPDISRLLDLGNPQCRQWLTDHICKLIAENGIRIYRQDFNFPPLAYWRDNDEVERQGMRENLHVQGYLHFWDDLLERNPGLWIDSCSSGGRRNDLETMRRSVPLHYSDYGYGDHPVKLAFRHTLYAWIPYFKDCTLAWDLLQPGDDLRFDQQIDRFSYYCGMAPMFFPTLDIRRKDYDFPLAVQLIAIWRTAARLLLFGDYYPLTPFSKDADKWVAWQFEIPKTYQGCVQAFRLADCKEEGVTIYPKVGNPTDRYWFENAETHQRIEVDGKDLTKNGFTLTQPARSGSIWFYQIVNAENNHLT